MSRRAGMLTLGSWALVAGLLGLVASTTVPLGILGQWTWPRVDVAVEPGRFPVLAVVLVVYVMSVTAVGLWLRAEGRTRIHEAAALLLLAALGTILALVLPGAAPTGYDQARWAFALIDPAVSGYYETARLQIDDLPTFLSNYQHWVASQNDWHNGTHPPGLLMLWRGLIDLMAAYPSVAAEIVATAPSPAQQGFSIMHDQYLAIPMTDRAAIVLRALLSAWAVGATVVPLYLLIRSREPIWTAWSLAACWPLVPSAILFQPISDTLYPVLAISALALGTGVRARGAWGIVAGLGSGIVLALGMAFSLVFLAVGLAVGIVAVWTRPLSPRRSVLHLTWIGLGFLAPVLLYALGTRSNPIGIWWTNRQNHAALYADYGRDFGVWQPLNLADLVVGLGLPLSLWGLWGFATRGGSVPRAAWAGLFSIVLSSLTGSALSEVARLWLPFFPLILCAAGPSWTRERAGWMTLVLTLIALGVQTIGLQAWLRVLSPIG